jgi:hypothetical protein
MAEAGWKSQNPLPPLRRVIGADLDQEQVYALDTKGNVVALDLQNGKVRVALSGVRDVTMGPDGALYMVDDSNSVTQMLRRTPVKFHTRLPGRPRDLFGTKDDQLLAVSSAAMNTLTVLRSDQAALTTLLPMGDVTATFWGDLVAVAADSSVVLYDPKSRGEPRDIPIAGHARAVLFSPSGHRLYVARRKEGIVALNRYTGEKVADIELPGPAGALRNDPFGRWLLVHPPTADSVYVVDLGTAKTVRALATEWSQDLPTVTNQQVLLTKLKQDIFAYDLLKKDTVAAGKNVDGGKDFWLSLAWAPGSPTTVPSAESTSVAATTDTTVKAKVFLQVSSSQNPAWADELAKQLSGAGLPASVLAPHTADEGYRVVLGPYASREEAEASGKKLGRPFFIYQPPPNSP